MQDSVGALSRTLNVAYSTSVKLVSVDCAYFSNRDDFSRTLDLAAANMGASELGELRRFIDSFPARNVRVDNRTLRDRLSRVRQVRKLCSPTTLKLTSTLTYNTFAFLLNNNPLRVVLTFTNTNVKGTVHYGLNGRRFALFVYVTISISSTYLMCTNFLGLTRLLFRVSIRRRTKCVYSVLFVVPNFPFVADKVSLTGLSVHSNLRQLTCTVVIMVITTIST